MNPAVALEWQVGLLRWCDEVLKPLTNRIDPGNSLPRIRATIADGQSIFVADPICALLAASQEHFPNVTLRPEDLGLTNGCAYFATPLVGPLPTPPASTDQGMYPLRGITWMPLRHDDFNGIMIAFWTHPPGVLGTWVEAVCEWPFGGGWRAFELGWNAWLLPYSSGEFESHDPDLARRRVAHHRRCWQALIAFMEQRILVATPERADRATRRRVEQQGWAHEPLIRVVQLRRKQPRDRPDREEHAEIDWSCQWLVRGHFRQQWFPSQDRHKAIYIAPHVKGPQDKPLRPPRATIFAVVR